MERIENIAGATNPDVHGGNTNRVEFWIEMKARPHLPMRDDTIILETMFEPGQIPWALEWERYGANCFVVARLGNELFLYNTRDIPGMTKAESRDMALAIGAKNIINYLASLEQ